jgi:glycosyltransferase involved in cell wall biosynthesis
MERPAGASLLFVNQHYAPDVAATGQCLTDLAEHLVRDGYSVDVMASRARYGAGRVDAPAFEIRNGVRVTRLSATGFGKRTHIGRVIDYASFYVKVLAKLLVGRPYDGVVFLTTPPLIALVGRLARAVRGQRYGIWSMDLHPEAEVAAGMLRDRSAAAKALGWLDRLAYSGADFVVDLGGYMRNRVLEKGVESSNAHTVNIWGGDGGADAPTESNPLTTHLGLEDKFVVMYSGNAGIVHDFGAIFEAMRELRHNPRVFFLFVGGGPRRVEVEAFAKREGLTNFAYHDYVPRELLQHSLSVAHAHLISLRPQFVGVSVPSKLYGVMASARPIIFVGPSRCETADAINEARCGVTIDPRQGGDEAAGQRMAAIIREWAADPALARQIGERGRAAFDGRYDQRTSCMAFERVIRSAWTEGVRVSHPTSLEPRPI